MGLSSGPPAWHDPDQLERFPVIDPEPTVSVILPHYCQVEELRRTLHALSAQDYPSGRLEIIVVDDGTERFQPESVTRLGGPVPIRVLVQRRDGFGLARARNLGADSAHGDVVLFLDSDMLPVPGFIRAHMRPHERLGYAVVVGTRRHLASQGVSEAQLLEAAQNAPNDMGSYLGIAEHGEPAWRSQLLASWRDLRDPAAQPYRIASGGNLSIRRERYMEFGSTSERFVQWGGEDTEFAYRATQQGAFFVFARDALAWHQGLSKELSPEERRSQTEQRDLLADLVPLPPFRTAASPRRHTVPLLTLDLDAAGCGADELLAFLDGVFERLPDAKINVTGTDLTTDRALDRAYLADTRVTRVDALPTSPTARAAEPLRAQALARGGIDAAADVIAGVQLLLDGGGAVGICRSPEAVIWLTAAEERLRRHESPAAVSVLDRLAEVFGARNIGPARDYVIRTHMGAGEDDLEAAIQALRRLFWRLPQRVRRLAVAAANYGRRRAVRRPRPD